MDNMKYAKEVIIKFWQEHETPSENWLSNERILCNINWIRDKISGEYKELIDLGTGDGTLLVSLLEFIKVERCIIVDLNAKNLFMAKNKILHAHSNIKLVSLCTDLSDIKIDQIDLCLALGLFIYLVDDSDVINVLRKVKAKQLIVRVPCTMKKSDELIVTYSEDLSSEYAAKYRTLQNMLDLLSQNYRIESYGRIFPDKIESKFGTKQFAFNCFRKSD